MSEYRDGIKIKTTIPSVALLKLLRKWHPNRSLSELRAMVQNHEYIYLTDQEKSWIEGDRKMAKLLKELDRAGFETELYRECQERPGCPWQADPMDREFFRNTLQTDQRVQEHDSRLRGIGDKKPQIGIFGTGHVGIILPIRIQAAADTGNHPLSLHLLTVLVSPQQ